jgi:chemotaxis protein CheD
VTGVIHRVGIAEMKISERSEDQLVAAHLGSCVALVVFDPVGKRGGMIHCLLPLSHADPNRAAEVPSTYVDSGVAALLEALMERGSNRHSLQLYAFGGAQMSDESKSFEIGNKNITILRKILWKNNLLLKAQDLGGDVSRTVTLRIGTGEVLLKVNGKETVVS